jgi:hypothetical protein
LGIGTTKRSLRFIVALHLFTLLVGREESLASVSVHPSTMGKSSDRRKRQREKAVSQEVSPPAVAKKENKKKAKKHEAVATPPTPRSNSSNSNPLRAKWQTFWDDLTPEERDHFFSDRHVTPERRASLWGEQATVGQELVDAYAWAIPDEGALDVLRHFCPLVEIGSGANAYWCRQMKARGMDVVAYDSDPTVGGKIGKASSPHVKHKKDGFAVQQGGPSVLTEQANAGRNLFLCYPDENDSAEEEGFSLGLACLEDFQGDYVVHVGEVYGDTLSVDQAPWGRSSSLQFQERLATEFHCVLQIPLPNWVHVRDTLTVWKRSSLCTLVFAADEEDEEDEDEEVSYRYIPPEERLPSVRVAPFLRHLLPPGEGTTVATVPKQAPPKSVEAPVSLSPKKKKQHQPPTGKEKARKEKDGYECPW